jgi:hypothetical protein
VTDKPRRLQTATERELASAAARRERAQSPAVEFVCDDVTGQYEGEELQRMRAQRKPDDRIGRLEEKHDSLVKVVTETRVEVAKISGQLEVLPKLVDAINQSVQRTAQRDHVTFTAKVDVDKAQALDVIDARKAKRDTYLKIAAALLTGGALGKLLHMLGVF